MAGSSDDARGEALPDATHAAVQKLSPFSGGKRSHYFKFVLRSAKTLDVVFTHALVPAGTFSLDNIHAGSTNSVLYLNTKDFDYYQHGIPDVTTSVEETVAWIEAIKAAFGFDVVRTVGMSMGGYAAIQFGDLVGADAVLAVSPVIDVDYILLRRSAPFPDPSGYMLRLGSRAAMTFGAFDVVDYPFLSKCLSVGMRPDDVGLVGSSHGFSRSIDFAKFAAAAGPVSVPELLVNRYASPLGPEIIREVAEAQQAIRALAHDRVADILGRAAAIDVHNPGFRYRRGVHLCLLGRRTEAVAEIREAVAVYDQHRKNFRGAKYEDESDLRKKLVRDYAGQLSFAQLKVLADIADDVVRSNKKGR